MSHLHRDMAWAGSYRYADDAIERLISLLSQAMRSSGDLRVAILDEVQHDIEKLLEQAHARSPGGQNGISHVPPQIEFPLFERQSCYDATVAKSPKIISHEKSGSVSGVEARNFDALTQREKEIMGHLAGGAANKEIARAMDISDATVKVHIRTILRKLGLKNRTQAALYAMQRSWLVPASPLSATT